MNKNIIIVKVLLILTSILFSVKAYAYTVSFKGAEKSVIAIEPDRGTGLDAIYVVYDMTQISEMRIEGLSTGNIEISKYSNLGGGYALEVPFGYDNNIITVSSPDGDMGYIINEGGRNNIFWVVDYSKHEFKAYSLNESSDSGCESTGLLFQGEGSPIHYYTIDGRQRTLSRELQLSFRTQEWNDEEGQYDYIDRTVVYESLGNIITVIPPVYCRSAFNLSGDRFQKEWGMQKSVTSPDVTPVSVNVHSSAVQTNISDDEESNMISMEGEGLGGSAPADIEFNGYVTDEVIHKEWQLASDNEFENILYRWTEQDVSYTFNEEGTFYARFIGSNSDGSCESFGDIYTINIGSSDLRIPNAFTPNGDGVNDIWKVGYRSLIEFKCWIFDSRGVELYYFDDPQGGWDGTYRGKAVKSGVYYYVIEARGADGKKYKKGGDINIVGYRRIGNASTPEE